MYRQQSFREDDFFAAVPERYNTPNPQKSSNSGSAIQGTNEGVLENSTPAKFNFR